MYKWKLKKILKKKIFIQILSPCLEFKSAFPDLNLARQMKLQILPSAKVRLQAENL